jgi:hypothetical protein
MTPPEYVLEAFHEGTDSTLYRGRQRAAQHPSWQWRIGYSLTDELEPVWGIKPLALTRHEGQTVIVLRPWRCPRILFLSGTSGIHSI